MPSFCCALHKSFFFCLRSFYLPRHLDRGGDRLKVGAEMGFCRPDQADGFIKVRMIFLPIIVPVNMLKLLLQHSNKSAAQTRKRLNSKTRSI